MHTIRILNTSLIFLSEATYYFTVLHNPSSMIFGSLENPAYWFSSTASSQDNRDFCWLLWMPQGENKPKPQKILLLWKNKKGKWHNIWKKVTRKRKRSPEVSYLLAVRANHTTSSRAPWSDHTTGPFYLSVSQSAGQRRYVPSLQTYRPA